MRTLLYGLSVLILATITVCAAQDKPLPRGNTGQFGGREIVYQWVVQIGEGDIHTMRVNLKAIKVDPVKRIIKLEIVGPPEIKLTR